MNAPCVERLSRSDTQARGVRPAREERVGLLVQIFVYDAKLSVFNVLLAWALLRTGNHLCQI